MKTIVLIALFIVMCTTFGTGIFLSLKHPNHTSIALIQYTAATICLIFLFLSKFKRFKFLHFEAETWNDVQNKAERLLNNLQNASLVNAEVAYSTLMAIGRFAEAISTKDRFKIANDLEKSLKELEFDEEKINKIKKHFNRMVIGDIAHPIITSITNQFFEIEKDIDKESPKGVIDESKRADHNKCIEKKQKAAEEINGFANTIRNGHTEGSNLLDIIKVFLSTSKFLNNEQKQGIYQKHKEDFENLESYIKNNTLTHEEHFFDKNK